MPSTDPLLRHVIAYVTAPTWEEAYAILQRDQQSLLTPGGARMLQQTLASARYMAANSPGMRDYASQAEERAAFYTEVQSDGFAAAWSRRQPSSPSVSTDTSQEIPLTREEIVRASADRAFLAARLGLPMTDPQLDAIQAQLRQGLTTAASPSGSAAELHQLLLDWLNTPTYDAMQQMLDREPRLLDPIMSDFLTQLIQQTQGQESERMLRASLGCLDVARQQGTLAGWHAFREAMGITQNQGGGNGVPPELQQILQELASLTRLRDMDRRVTLLRTAIRIVEEHHLPDSVQAALIVELGNGLSQNPHNDRSANLEEAIGCYQRALPVYTREQYPEQYAQAQNNLGNTYQNRIEGERRENLEEALRCYQRALPVYTREQYPEDYAMTQNNLGITYSNRIEGERRENLEETLRCYQRALLVRTREQYPKQYATTQNNLGNTYQNRIEGERRENLEEALRCYQRALLVRTREQYPKQYAQTQNNLGATYNNRIEGERRENLEEALRCYQRALPVYTREQYPEQYATTQNNLGNTYQNRIEGERRENLEEALRCYQRALLVRTREQYPKQYAQTQNNLGATYNNRIEGERRENLEEALRCYERALPVYTREQYPEQYAMTQNNLGLTYADRIEGERRENLEEALRCFQRALPVYTREQYPEDYAMTQNNLGATYQKRIEGERRENLEEALRCYQRALQVRTREQYPEQYAQTQNNLGITYGDRIEGERRENLEEAIRCYERALQVSTREQFPEQFAQTQNNLGTTYADRIEGERRENLEEAIRCYERALQVSTREQYPEEYAMTQNNLGNTYADRIEGERRANLEEALRCFQRALPVYTREQYPEDYAMTQNNLGATYQKRIEGERRENLEEALRCYQRALPVYTREQYPEQFAQTQNNLGITYGDRIEGERRENLEEALRCYERALQVSTREQFPEQFAQTQNNLGTTYADRIEGERRENLEEALRCLQRALLVYTHEQYPSDYRDTQLNLAWAALDAQVAEARDRGDAADVTRAYRRAHTAFLAAREAHVEIGWLATDPRGRALAQGEHRLREQYARDAWCCWQMGDLRGAIVALESGRALALIEAQSVAGAILSGIPADLGDGFTQARDALEAARITTIGVTEARERFLLARKHIRDAGHPEFLPGTPTWEEIAAAPDKGQSLAYLAATDFGGLLLVVPPDREPWGVAITGLTWQVVADWLIRPDATRRIVGGYQYALHNGAMEILARWLQQLDSAEQQRILGLPLHQVPGTVILEFTTLRTALADMVAGWQAEATHLQHTYPTQAAELHVRLGTTLEEIRQTPVFERELRWHFVQAELALLLRSLGEACMYEIRAALDAHGLGGEQRPIALIPCGRLGALPVHAAPVRPDDPTPFLETCELTLQPAARTLAASRDRLRHMPAAGPILAVGDPWPTWVERTNNAGKTVQVIVDQLHWAAAEADGIDVVAENARVRRAHTKLIGPEATIEALRTYLLHYAADPAHPAGAWVQIAAHGSSDPADPNRSAMLFAQGKQLTLATLQQQALLRGVRLFNASGCVTGLGDLETAPDELGSFAAGVLQAGAVGAIATLWSVSDQATFLLMLRFAQYFLAPPESGQSPITPARALRHAVHWLRTVSRDEITQLANIARNRITTIPQGKAGREFDTDRGLLLDLWERMSSDKHTVTDAFKELPAMQRYLPDTAAPCAHPYFWAAFIVYGA